MDLVQDAIVRALENRLIAATGLQLVRYEAAAPTAGRPASEADYVGPKGCRLSVFETAAAPGSLGAPGALSDPALSIESSGSLLIARWAAQGRYVLISRGMDQERFATIARSLATATAHPGADDGDLLAVLSVAHQHCVG